MAHVERRGEGRWRARYRDPSGRERSRTFRRKVDAERFLLEQEAAKAHGSWIDPSAGARQFDDYAAVWRSAQVHRPSTAEQVESHLRNHILPTFGERQLGSVRTSEVQAWVKSRSETLAPSTVEVVYRILAAIFRSAVDDRVIASSPCTRRVKLPRKQRKQVEPLETDTVTALADVIEERYRALVVLAAGTGLRQGEAFGVTIDRVDFLRRQLRVDRQLVTPSSGEPAFGPPKTEASSRTVPLPDVVLTELARHLEQFEPGEWGLLFTTESGSPLRRNRFNDGPWRRAVREVDRVERVSFHELRHYYASLLIRYGESVKVVQSRLGHASASETLDTYSHLWPDSEDTTRAAVDSVLRTRPRVLADQHSRSISV